MNKYQEALNRIKTAPSFIGGTDLYKTHLNSSELFLQDIDTLQELINKDTPQKVSAEYHAGYDPQLYYPKSFHCPSCSRRLRGNQSYKYCPKCGQALDWIYI